MKILACLMLISCASWTPTHKAVIRREAESKLRSCVTSQQCRYTRECMKESAEWCVTNGLEKTCGIDGVFNDRIVCDPFMRH